MFIFDLAGMSNFPFMTQAGHFLFRIKVLLLFLVFCINCCSYKRTNLIPISIMGVQLIVLLPNQYTYSFLQDDMNLSEDEQEF